MKQLESIPTRRVFIRFWKRAYWRLVVLLCVCVTLIPVGGFERGPITFATAPYRFSTAGWEFANLPDKWIRRWILTEPDTPWINGPEQRVADAHEFFAVSRSLWSTERQLLELEAASPTAAGDIASLRERQTALTERQGELRAPVEETLEATIAETLGSLGFWAMTGPFPPVDTVLSPSPTILVTSPRDRIERLDNVTMQTGLTHEERDRIESQVEEQTDLSAVVLNTGGIAMYPSITVPHGGLDFALEVIAHEWVHHWLWFRPLGRRYFQGGDLTTMNETVANIAGREIGALARERLARSAPISPGTHLHDPPETVTNPTADPPRFDFHEEMRATRIRVDEMLAAGRVDEAEVYMEKRRREFVAHGYRLRKLNQAYFAFHGTYADTGAAGVSVVGQQIEELRQRSPTLADFLRTAAEFKTPEELAEYLNAPGP